MNDTKTLLRDAEDHLIFVTVRPPVIMRRGSGMHIWDTDGRRYLDFIGGWAVNTLGHSPAAVRRALGRQSRALVNASPSFYNEPMIELAAKLTRHAGLDRAWFGNSGAEVNEGALKMARKYGTLKKNGAFQVITTLGSFHGRTLAMMSATGKPQWDPLFAPKVPGFVHVPFNDLQAMRTAVNEQTVAVMIELIQGEGGVQVGDRDYVRGVRALCDEFDIILIIDEVQTGMGRTGALFGFQHYGIEPDVMTLAKGLGSGFPVAALLAKEKYCLFEKGEQGGTFGGNPLAMAVGLAVLDEVLNRGLCARARSTGEYLKEQLTALADRFGFTNIRGLGLLIGLDLTGDEGERIVAECLARGLIINSPRPNMIRFIPPLICEKKHVDSMLKIFTAVLVKIYGK